MQSDSGRIPSEAPPPYSQTAPNGSSTSSAAASYRPAPNTSYSSSNDFLQVPFQHVARNGIPPEHRRSMEDLGRELPKGWLRQFDSETGHQFYVDSHTERSIWHHPYDDAEYMQSLPEKERERIAALHPMPSHADIAAESSDDDDDGNAAWLAEQSAKKEDLTRPPKQKDGISRRMKNKLTGTTHEEREVERAKRAKEEQRAYELHMAVRRGMQKAVETGKPVKIMRNADGQDIYIEPPGGGSSGVGADGRAYNPSRDGPYSDPNARFFRPVEGYNRGYGNYGYPGTGQRAPVTVGSGFRGAGTYGGYGGYGGGYGGYGRGYGGGMGLPLMGGLGGGLLLGSMLGGGFGMGGMGMGGMGMGMGGGFF